MPCRSVPPNRRGKPPAVFLVLGVEGIRHMERIAGMSLPRDRFIPVEMRGRRVSVITGRHLSRGWSYEKVDGLGEQLREVCRFESCAYFGLPAPE
jgi:hypothetical protein